MHLSILQMLYAVLKNHDPLMVCVNPDNVSISMQCDSWAHRLQLWPEGPSHGSGHSLLLIPGDAACGTQQPACPPVHSSQQQRCQPHPHAPHSCNVPVSRHAICCWQVRVHAGMVELDAPIFAISVSYMHTCISMKVVTANQMTITCQTAQGLIVCMPSKSCKHTCQQIKVFL